MLETLRRRLCSPRLWHSIRGIPQLHHHCRTELRKLTSLQTTDLTRNSRGLPSAPLWIKGHLLSWNAAGHQSLRWCETHATTSVDVVPSKNLLNVQSCDSSSAVLELVQPFLETMNLPDVCVVLNVLKRFPAEPQSELMDELAKRIIKHKDALQPRHVSTIFHACAKLSYMNTELFETLAQQSMLPFQMEAFSHREASAVLHSIGLLIKATLRQHKTDCEPVIEAMEFEEGVPEWAAVDRTSLLCPSQAKFMELLLRRFVTVTEFDAVAGYQVSNVFYGVAAVHTIDKELLRKLTNMAIHGPIFRELTDHELCNIIVSFGYLNIYDPEAMDLILLELLQPSRLPLLSENGITGMLHGLSLLHYDNRHNLLVLMAEMVRPWRLRKYTERDFTGVWYNCGQLGIRDVALLDPLMKETMHPERLQSLSPKALFSIVMSMGRLKYRNNDFLHAFVDELVSERRAKITDPRDFPGYIWILGQLQYNHKEDLKQVMDCFMRTCDMTQLPARTIASAFYGLAQCNVYDASYLDPLLEETVRPERLQSFAAHSLASVVHSLGRMAVPMSPSVDAILREALTPEKLSQYSEYGLVAIVNGITGMELKDEQLLKNLMDEVRKSTRVAAYKPSALNCLVFGLGGLCNHDMDLVTRLTEEIVKPEKLSLLSKSGVTALIISLSELKFDNVDILTRLVAVVIDNQELRSMSDSNLAAFVCALGQINYSCSKEMILPIIDEVTMRRASFSDQELSSVLYGFGQMGLNFNDFYTLQHLVAEALESERISSYDVKELGRICSALSSMEYAGPSLEPLLQRLFQPEVFQNLDFRDLAASAYALGHIDVKNETLVYQVKQEVFRRGKSVDANERSLALLIQGLGPLCRRKDYAIGQVLLEMVHHSFSDSLSGMSNQTITAILYGLGQIGVESKVMLYPLIKEAIATRRLQQYTSHALSSLIFGMGQFRFRDKQALLPVVQEASRNYRLKYFNGRQLMGNIFSFCNMEMVYEELLEPLLKAASRPELLSRCTDADLSMFFFSLVKIKPQDHGYLQNAIAEATQQERLQSLGDTSLSAILFSITGLREFARTPEVLRPILDQLCLPGRLTKMQGTILGSILYSLGRMEFLPVDFMDVVANEASKPARIRSFNETTLCNIINAVGKAKYDNRSFISVLMEEAMQSHRLAQYHEGHIVNITYALGALRFHHPRFIAFMDRVLSDLREVDKFQPKTLLMIMHTYQLLKVGSHQTVTNVSRSVFANPKRLALLSDVQLSCLMDTLGNIQKTIGSAKRQVK